MVMFLNMAKMSIFQQKEDLLKTSSFSGHGCLRRKKSPGATGGKRSAAGGIAHSGGRPIVRQAFHLDSSSEMAEAWSSRGKSEVPRGAFGDSSPPTATVKTPHLGGWGRDLLQSIKLGRAKFNILLSLGVKREVEC